MNSSLVQLYLREFCVISNPDTATPPALAAFPGAKGNLATEDLVHLCESSGLTTGVDVNQLWSIVQDMEAKIGRPIGGQSKPWYQSQQKACTGE